VPLLPEYQFLVHGGMKNKMHERTKLTLEQLENAEWFAKVGKPYQSEEPKKLLFIKTWEEAIQWCSSQYWDDLILEAQNQYREKLFERSIERFRLWNDIVDEMKKHTIPLVERKTEKVIIENDLPKIFSDCVDWDILGVCMEAEFADVFPPGFFASQAFWYVRGRFPCGWQGDFPDGKLVIF
jgi:hypothetical protein